MAIITFDGPTKTITVGFEGAMTSVTVQEVYSLWKQWVQASDNAKYLPAFSNSVGGNAIDADTSLDGYYFIRNDLGWRIKPDETNYELIIDGNLFGFDPLADIWSPTVGNFNVQVRLISSARALVKQTGISGLTPTESSQLSTAATETEALRKLLRNKLVTDPVNGTITIYDDDGTTILFQANLFEDAAGTQAYRGRGSERRERLE